MAPKLFASFLLKALNKEIDFDTDTIKVALTTSTYTPNFDTHDYFNDVTNEVVGTGYTAGGATLASKTITTTAANSWATARANSTAYALNAVVRPSTGNGFLYQASTAGTSAASPPTYPTVVGQTVTDGSVVWTCVGSAIVQFDAADASWTTSTITARTAVVYESTGTAGTSALIMADVNASDQSSSAGTFTAAFDALGIAYFFV
jgi:hypothetical protein